MPVDALKFPLHPGKERRGGKMSRVECLERS